MPDGPKQLLLLATVLAASASLQPCEATTTVYSDVVGFVRVTLDEGRNFVSVPFQNDEATLASLLGTNQLPSGDTEIDATAVDVWNEDDQALTNRYWLSNPGAFGGWRRSVTFEDVNNLNLDLDKGLVVTIRGGEGSQDLVLVGTVKTNARSQAVVDNGYTVMGSPFPQGRDLDSLGLVESGFTGSDSFISSDLLLFFDPESQLFNEKFWYNAVAGEWVDADNGQPADKTVAPGEAFLVRRRDRGSDFTWTNRPPFTLP